MNKHYTFQEYVEKFANIQDSYDYYFELQKENDRLNNIINELEEWLEDKVFNKVGSSVDIAIENHTYCKVLDKLKELKENNNAKD